jgi:hypothetical protein
MPPAWIHCAFAHAFTSSQTRLAAGCTIKKTKTALVVGIYGEGVPHGEHSSAAVQLWPLCSFGLICVSLRTRLTSAFAPSLYAGDCNIVVEGLADYLIESSL